MKVADSSYLVEAVLRNASLLEGDVFIARDFGNGLMLAEYEFERRIYKSHRVGVSNDL